MRSCFVICSLLLNYIILNAQCCAAGNPIIRDGNIIPKRGDMQIMLNHQKSLSDTYFEGNRKSDFNYKNA